MNFRLELSRIAGPNIAKIVIGEESRDTIAPESRSHVLDSSVVSKTSDSTGCSMDSMFGSVVKILAEELT